MPKVTPEAPKMGSNVSQKSSKMRVRILIRKRYRKSVIFGSLGPSRLRLPCRREHDFEKISMSKKVVEKGAKMEAKMEPKSFQEASSAPGPNMQNVLYGLIKMWFLRVSGRRLGSEI